MNWGVFFGLLSFGLGLSSMVSGIVIESAYSFFIGLFVYIIGCLSISDELPKRSILEGNKNGK